MSWNFAPDKPVFLQITDAIKTKILTGEFSPDEQLPSVRAIAEEAGVNPNTVQRALTVLEQSGLVVTRGTIGRFVTADSGKLKELIDAEIGKETDVYLARVSAYGVDGEQAAQLIKSREDKI